MVHERTPTRCALYAANCSGKLMIVYNAGNDRVDMYGMKQPNLPYCYKHPHPAVAADLVIFSLREDELALLLIERGSEPYQGQWALPGGFVKIDETLNAAAQRELKEETGLAHAYLEQVSAFGDPQRDPRERVISVAYFAIINADKVALHAGTDARRAEWHLVRKMPKVALDHRDIITAAREKVIDKMARTAIALEFLPTEFTLTELQRVFEAVRGEQMDKRNFRKWADTLSFIKPTGKLRRGGQHRPAALYRALAGGHATVNSSALAAGGVEVVESQVASDAYQRGYEDAVAALGKAFGDTQKSVLRSATRR